MDKQKLLQALFLLQNEIGANTEMSRLKRAVCLSRLEALDTAYRNIDIPKSTETLLQSLIKKCGEVTGDLETSRYTKEKTRKLEYFIRCLKASLYDFRGEAGIINKYTRLYIATAALFMALTPQFYGYVLPIIFIMPVFSGLKGLKKRNRTGFLMTLALLPAALMTSITWLRYMFQVALPAYRTTTTSTALMWQVSPAVAQLLIIVPGLLSALLAVVASAAAYYGFRLRDMFV